MNFLTKMFSAALLITAVGCGGGSGVDSDKYVDELTTEEVTTLCEWAAEEQGGPGEKTCTADSKITVRTTAECVADMNRPHCQVKLIEDCFASIDGNSCNILTSAECGAYVQCALSSD